MRCMMESIDNVTDDTTSLYIVKTCYLKTSFKLLIIKHSFMEVDHLFYQYESATADFVYARKLYYRYSDNFLFLSRLLFESLPRLYSCMDGQTRCRTIWPYISIIAKLATLTHIT